ncbi:gas vesicle protein GvpG [Streptomyces sp. WMMC500]|uniref:gas vesicle protein GvpG n=1 Tax=Streptomyces sp. WMMC500 TaxID=3015154 RepID=UPI00248B66ED|nr:gas vesicle protein GvpG [Streptomyces sp. WMMC500]WBB62515.1 gas vesicle protein GvpG [Streptomyces sp. WMMC500]
MGLLSGVLLLPLTPVRGVEWVADRLLDVAERELYDPGTLRVQLGELNRAYEAGELDEEEFEREEERLLDLLEGPGMALPTTPGDSGDYEDPGDSGNPDNPPSTGSGS